MGILAAKRNRSESPIVRVTGTRQLRIAFSPTLVEKSLENIEYLAVDHDEAKRRLRFIPSEAVHENQSAHKLRSDGGKSSSAARIILVSPKTFDFLPLGSYEPTFIKNGSFDIHYGGK